MTKAGDDEPPSIARPLERGPASNAKRARTVEDPSSNNGMNKRARPVDSSPLPEERRLSQIMARDWSDVYIG